MSSVPLPPPIPTSPAKEEALYPLEHTAPAAEPQMAAPTAEPQTVAPTAEPQTVAPTAGAQMAVPAAEARMTADRHIRAGPCVDGHPHAFQKEFTPVGTCWLFWCFPCGIYCFWNQADERCSKCQVVVHHS